MSLQENIAECRLLMSEVQANKAKVSQETERAKINNTFFDAYNNFLLPNLKAYVAIKENTTFSFSPDMITKMTNCLNVVSDAIDKNHILSNPNSFRANAVNLRDGLTEEWQKHCAEISSDILDNLGVLRLVYQDKYLVNRIVNSIRGLALWPVSAEQIIDYRNALDKANSLLKDMHFDPVIDTFLRNVRDKKATLADLSDPIIKWIRDNHFESSIQLIIS